VRLVYGLGRSGLGVLRYLNRHGLEAEYHDDNLSPVDQQAAEALGFRPASWQPYTQVVAAPGIPIDHPKLLELSQAGAQICGEAELVYRHSATPLIGITGTAGKTSCTLFTGHFLRAMGFKAVEGGNIDPPLTDVVDGAQVVAVELSSFQLERIHSFRPRVAVMLRLGVDHLDRHKTLERYHQAKLNLLKNLTDQDALVYNAQDPVIATAAASSPAKLYAFEPAPGPRDTNLRAAEQAALAYAAIAGKSSQNLKPYWETAPKPQARYDLFATHSGLNFIDDSIATRADAVHMALQATPGPIAWILGGVDKGAPLDGLKPLVESKVRLILGIGQDGPRMADAFRGLTEVIDISEPTGQAALSTAVRIAREKLNTGSVLLAPLGTSFDQFKDYKERSKVFRQVVARLMEAK
jgi:UDP-N-acetylmuramoylalanine--D-glutamate ligase